MKSGFKHNVLERFLRYVKIDTQSDPTSPTCPSTIRQKDLGKVLENELKELGIKDAHMDDFGYVYATIPSNSHKNVPVICFCSHMDTSPDCSGKNVKAIIHGKYGGGDIVLPDDNKQVISIAEHPDLANQIGNDIITASGTTLLGADNKAGVAAIMDAASILMAHPNLRHGTIKILFTPDEEIGRGVDNVDLKKLGANYAYTIDGEKLGSLENETFSADSLTLTVFGKSAHPGFAKGKMENAIKIISEIIKALPKEKLAPESTSGREGFIHPVSINGMVEKATVLFIIRDFIEEKLKEHESEIRETMNRVLKMYPHSIGEISITEQYRNMKVILDKHPQVINHAIKAIERAGINPVLSSIRGGTDGSRLSFMGLPCPNIFAGEHAFHSKQEWVSVQDMEKAAETIVHLCSIWEEES